MSGKATIPSKSKGSVLRTSLTWIIDIAILAGLIYFFQSPINQSRFWSAIGGGLGVVVGYGVDLYKKSHLALAEKRPQSHPASQSQISAPTPTGNSNVKPESSAESSPFPLTFLPPPIVEKSKTEAHNLPDSVASMPSQPGPRNSRMKTGAGKPVLFEKRKVNGIPFYQATIDLTDPETFLEIGLANNAPHANSAEQTYGHENFETMVKKHPGAFIMNGTFFSKDEQERVMGNVVSEGKVLKYSQWEDYGTTFGLKADNQPTMVTARVEGQPNWNEHWFSLTCGPRLVKAGSVWVHPEEEGFTDSHVLGIGPRCAIGFNQSGDKLIMTSFLRGLSLVDEARLMQSIGCFEAMNLDGGASKALAYNGKVIIPAGRALTNIVVVYDSKHPAPKRIAKSWTEFQSNFDSREYLPASYNPATRSAHSPGL